MPTLSIKQQRNEQNERDGKKKEKKKKITVVCPILREWAKGEGW